jgi:hypothetical protein
MFNIKPALDTLKYVFARRRPVAKSLQRNFTPSTGRD